MGTTTKLGHLLQRMIFPKLSRFIPQLNSNNIMKKLILILSLFTATQVFSQLPPAMPCLTNLDLYCTGNNQVSTSQNGSSTAPTNEVHGMDLLCGDCGGTGGLIVNIYGTCSSSKQIVAVLVFSCTGAVCGGGTCAAGSHEVNITIPAGCSSVTGKICFTSGACCSVVWNPMFYGACSMPGD